MRLPTGEVSEERTMEEVGSRIRSSWVWFSFGITQAILVHLFQPFFKLFF